MLTKTLDVGTYFLGPPVLLVSQTCMGTDGQQARVKPEEHILVHIPSLSLTSSEPSGKSIKLSEFLFPPMSGSGRIA